MYYGNVDADQKPQKVMEELLPGGKRTIRMTDDVKEYRQEDAKDRTMYRFEEVVFDLPESVTVTKEQIEADFATWWEYGKKDPEIKEPEIPEPGTPDTMTKAEMSKAIKELQQQNTMLVDCLLEMSEVVYA